MPFSITPIPGTRLLPSPLDLIRDRFAPDGIRSRVPRAAREINYFLKYPVIVIVGWLIALCMIPRRMKSPWTRAGHLLRVSVLSAMFLVLARMTPLIMHSRFAVTGRHLGGTEILGNLDPEAFFVFSTPVAILVMTIWWVFACKSHLRLKRWLLMGISISLFGFIAIPTFLFFTLRAIM